MTNQTAKTLSTAAITNLFFSNDMEIFQHLDADTTAAMSARIVLAIEDLENSNLISGFMTFQPLTLANVIVQAIIEKSVLCSEAILQQAIWIDNEDSYTSTALEMFERDVEENGLSDSSIDLFTSINDQLQELAKEACECDAIDFFNDNEELSNLMFTLLTEDAFEFFRNDLINGLVQNEQKESAEIVKNIKSRRI